MALTVATPRTAFMIQTHASEVTKRRSAGTINNGVEMPVKILGICGSLRRESLNLQLLRAAEQILPEGSIMKVTRIDDLPLMNPDLERHTSEHGILVPLAVERLRLQVAWADAVLFATPEYNLGVPGPLKNAIDWINKPLWMGKSGAIVSIAGPFSGVLGQQALRQTVPLMFLRQPELHINQLGPEGHPFLPSGEPTPTIAKKLAAVVAALVKLTRCVRDDGCVVANSVELSREFNHKN